MLIRLNKPFCKRLHFKRLNRRRQAPEHIGKLAQDGYNSKGLICNPRYRCGKLFFISKQKNLIKDLKIKS